MFGMGDKKVESSFNPGEVMGLIGKGMRMEGRLDFEGTVRIEGHFKGEVVSSGTLIVGETGSIEGEINIDTAVIAGEIKGTINAKSKVELNAPARITGDIRTPTLIICEGVVFDGNCIMTKRERQAELRGVDGGIGSTGAAG